MFKGRITIKMLKRILSVVLNKCFHSNVGIPFNKTRVCLDCGKVRDFNENTYKMEGKWRKRGR